MRGAGRFVPILIVCNSAHRRFHMKSTSSVWRPCPTLHRDRHLFVWFGADGRCLRFTAAAHRLQPGRRYSNTRTALSDVWEMTVCRPRSEKANSKVTRKGSKNKFQLQPLTADLSITWHSFLASFSTLMTSRLGCCCLHSCLHGRCGSTCSRDENRMLSQSTRHALSTKPQTHTKQNKLLFSWRFPWVRTRLPKSKQTPATGTSSIVP